MQEARIAPPDIWAHARVGRCEPVPYGFYTECVRCEVNTCVYAPVHFSLRQRHTYWHAWPPVVAGLKRFEAKMRPTSGFYNEPEILEDVTATGVSVMGPGMRLNSGSAEYSGGANTIYNNFSVLLT